MKKEFTGSDAWRNGFSVNAANVLQVYRVFSGMTDAEFSRALVECAKRSRGRKTNECTVTDVIQQINDSLKYQQINDSLKYQQFNDSLDSLIK